MNPNLTKEQIFLFSAICSKTCVDRCKSDQTGRREASRGGGCSSTA